MQTAYLFTRRVLGLLAGLFFLSYAGGAEIVEVKKIWDAGGHNAFTDLVRWHDRWWCTFRESEAHVGGDGVIRILTSSDGAKWESAATLIEKDVDLRDPKLSEMPDGRLMLVCGGSIYLGTKELKGRPPPTREFFRRWENVERAAENPERGRLAVAGDLARQGRLRRIVSQP